METILQNTSPPPVKMHQPFGFVACEPCSEGLSLDTGFESQKFSVSFAPNPEIRDKMRWRRDSVLSVVIFVNKVLTGKILL